MKNKERDLKEEFFKEFTTKREDWGREYDLCGITDWEIQERKNQLVQSIWEEFVQPNYISKQEVDEKFVSKEEVLESVDKAFVFGHKVGMGEVPYDDDSLEEELKSLHNAFDQLRSKYIN